MFYNNSTYQNDIKLIVNSFDFSYLKNKSVLVIGGNGLIGSAIIDVLFFLNKELNYNIQINTIIRSLEKFNKRFQKVIRNSIHIVIQDINNNFDYNTDCDYIINLASESQPNTYTENALQVIKTNTLGLENILAKINAKKTKFLHTSSFEVYGDLLENCNITEDYYGSLNFNKIRSSYPISKQLSEVICRYYFEAFNINMVILRLGYIYGATCNINGSKADIDFLKKSLKDKNIELKSSGKQLRSYCYVFDVITAILLTLNNEGFNIYNVSNKKSNISLMDFAEELARLSNKNIILTNKDKNELHKYSIIDSSKIYSIGWKPLFDYKQGIKHTYDILKESNNA
ncbi:NAD(P)-dependent oxidoreductase [Campylobacter sp. 2018MI13]|uniref:NAD-dependent epimerase/dehydratase family protein n=1 Tax=Campylobacter sp. 2018MI13 TaxID=2836737 RepID=UPI001BDAF93C|nr:NAD(P)-dependent oxidoreductase [Campylobacter sp. 2018MI13]MBT0883451.1 NAD(P)-dependent oxidoreductase [Campylobacter sp. 2018MI13]